MVNQREVGTDVLSFTDGLRSALREDPDVILLGEMRDLDSIAITLTLAETGHLVFATLHTNDASQALDRIVDVFPPERRDQIQIMLAGSLQGVISQRLLPAEGGGRVAAYEVLMANDAVRNLVREGKTRQLRNTMISGSARGHADDRDGPRPSGRQRHHQLRDGSRAPVPTPRRSWRRPRHSDRRCRHRQRSPPASPRPPARVNLSASDAVEIPMMLPKLPYKTLGGIVPCPGGLADRASAPCRSHGQH